MAAQQKTTVPSFPHGLVSPFVCLGSGQWVVSRSVSGKPQSLLLKGKSRSSFSIVSFPADLKVEVILGARAAFLSHEVRARCFAEGSTSGQKRPGSL